MGIDISTLQCQEISAKVSVNLSTIFFLIKYRYRCWRYFHQKVSVSILAIIFESIVNNTDYVTHNVRSCTSSSLVIYSVPVTKLKSEHLCIRTVSLIK